MRRPRFALLLLLVASSCGAQRLEGAFARDYSCPSHRVTGRSLDGPPAELTQPTPPDPAISEDPERLAMWRQQHAQQYAGRSWYEVLGCGRRNIYACGFPNPRGGDGCRLVDERRE